MICNTRRCTSRPSLKAKWRKGSVLSMQWKLPHQVLPSFNSGGGDFATSDTSVTSESQSTSMSTVATQTSVVSTFSIALQCTSSAMPEVLDQGRSRLSAHGPRVPARTVPEQPQGRAAGPFIASRPSPPVHPDGLTARPGCCSACLQPLVDVCRTPTNGQRDMMHHVYAASKFAICPACFRRNLKLQHQFQWSFSLANHSYVNLQNRFIFRIDGLPVGIRHKHIRLPSSFAYHHGWLS